MQAPLELAERIPFFSSLFRYEREVHVMMGQTRARASSHADVACLCSMRAASFCLLTATIALLTVFGCTSDLADGFKGGDPPDGGTPRGSCPAGQYGNDDCMPCDVGTYCPEGTLEPVDCVAGTWDHDADPETRCEPWTNCLAGSYIADTGTAIRDRRCVVCADGQFTIDPNSPVCSSWTACEPGYHVRIAGTTDTDQICSPCPAGTFTDEPNLAQCAEWNDCAIGEQVKAEGTPGADRQCETCPEGTFSTSENAPGCSSHRGCEPGTFVDSSGSDSTDAACSGCPSGTFSSTMNAESCAEWTDCLAGEFVAELGTATDDRQCEPCPPDTESFGVNSGACVAVGECPPGTVEVTPSTESTPAECDDCEPGQYCAGGSSEAVDCGDGDWDNDEDPATPCVAQTMCSPGEYILAPGDATTDRSCDACPGGTYSSTVQSPSCTEWTSCPPGSYVQMAGSSITDRECADCGSGTFTTVADEPLCVPWSVCAAPSTYVTEEPSATQDRECDSCDAPEVTLSDNSLSCTIPTFQMTDGTVVMEAESYHAQDLNGSNHAWELSAAPLASGDSCMSVNPDADYTWSESIALEYAPRLDFRVNFTSTGTFYLHLRGDPRSGGAGNDSCLAGLNGSFGPAYDFDDAQASWSWRQQGFWVNREGAHVVSVWARDDGFCLDKIVLSTNPNSPSGEGPAESEQE